MPRMYCFTRGCRRSKSRMRSRRRSPPSRMPSTLSPSPPSNLTPFRPLGRVERAAVFRVIGGAADAIVSDVLAWDSCMRASGATSSWSSRLLEPSVSRLGILGLGSRNRSKESEGDLEPQGVEDEQRMPCRPVVTSRFGSHPRDVTVVEAGASWTGF